MHPNDLPAQSVTLQTPITVAEGDGIGPEIMQATLRILDAAGARLNIQNVEIGERSYLSGVRTGMPEQAWASLRETRVFLKAPITTPRGGGYKSLNVTTRKALGLYANVRPCVAYAPFVPTRHPAMDVVVVRENEEDLYAGIEHRQTHDVVQCLKLITRPGCERIVRYAFEYARRHGRKKVTCMIKDNIMKLTDGLFRQVFDEVGAQYSDLERDTMIIDIGAAMLADQPELFDVIVTPNLYGDILSDITAQIAGSVGMAGSANIGDQCAMFEAIHGSAPDIAGKDVANPSGLLHGAILMLLHIGQNEVAERIHNAWLSTIERGIHTRDIHDPETSHKLVGTRSFADEVIRRLGHKPEALQPVHYAKASAVPQQAPTRLTPTAARAHKQLVGVDLFLHWRGSDVDTLATRLKGAQHGTGLALEVITNRGVRVWPNGFPETFCVDHWRCRFIGDQPSPISPAELQRRVVDAGLDVVKTENLYHFDGEPGFSAVHG